MVVGCGQRWASLQGVMGKSTFPWLAAAYAAADVPSLATQIEYHCTGMQQRTGVVITCCQGKVCLSYTVAGTPTNHDTSDVA